MSQFEGCLVKGKCMTIYWIYHDQKHHILNMSVFNKLFESQSVIKNVDEQVIESLSSGFTIDEQAKIKQGENAIDITFHVGGRMIKLTKDMIEKAQFNIQELPNKKQLDELVEKGKELLQNIAESVAGNDTNANMFDELKSALGGQSPEDMINKLKSFMK